MVTVMESLKLLGLGYHLVEALKILGPEKGLVKDILNFSIMPFLQGSDTGIKYRLYVKVKA